MSKLLQRTQKITSKIINKMPTTGLFLTQKKRCIHGACFKVEKLCWGYVRRTMSCQNYYRRHKNLRIKLLTIKILKDILVRNKANISIYS